MKNCSVLFIAFLFINISCNEKNDGTHFPVLKGNYFGQSPPSDSAEIFAPNIISTGFDELNSVFSPSCEEFYFSIKRLNQDRHVMFMMRRVENVWHTPQLLAFSGQYGDADPAFTADGTRMYFVSKRPLSSQVESKVWNIWFVVRENRNWSKPKCLDFPINTDNHEIHPSLTKNGTLYFSSNRSGGMGSFDIYCSQLLDGKYAAPTNLGEVINTEFGEGDLFVSPDESYIIFSSSRPGGFGRNDLYISFKKKNGTWSIPQNMGSEINSEEIEYCPSVSPDGKFLFFSSYRKINKYNIESIKKYSDIHKLYSSPQNGLGNIFWIGTRIIEKLKRNVNQ